MTSNQIDIEAIRARDAQWVSKPWHDFVAYAVDPTKPFAKDGQTRQIDDRRALLAEVDHLTTEYDATRQALREVTAAYGKQQKVLGAVRAAVGMGQQFAEYPVGTLIQKKGDALFLATLPDGSKSFHGETGSQP